MHRSKWLLARLAFTLIAVLSLTFGATEVFAATKTCPDNGGFPYLGECATHKECTLNCAVVHGPGALGTCGPDNCCICQF